jgi:hypothetical protein
VNLSPGDPNLDIENELKLEAQVEWPEAWAPREGGTCLLAFYMPMARGEGGLQWHYARGQFLVYRES